MDSLQQTNTYWELEQPDLKRKVKKWKDKGVYWSYDKRLTNNQFNFHKMSNKMMKNDEK